jgi:hypothetical protein
MIAPGRRYRVGYGGQYRPCAQRRPGHVSRDIQVVLEATHRAGAIMKVIFENCYLQDKHKEVLAKLTAGRKNGDRHKCRFRVLLDL